MGYVYKTDLPLISSGEVSDPYRAAKIIITAGWQKRVNPLIHPLLMQASKERAEDMAKRNYFSHTSPDGVTPNEVVRSVGYILPSWYPQKGNNVESIYIGYEKPEDPIQTWFDSPKHHDHLTGGTKFYADQRAVGVGTAKAKSGQQLWVLISAPAIG